MAELVKKQQTLEHSIPYDVLNDVMTRFILVVPEAAKENLIRVCFQIELAHWFYLDFYVGNDDRCKSCSIYEFAAHIFQLVPYLRSEIPRLHDILADWKEYKQSVPTYGAIILSEGLTHVLLVQSYWAKASWGFPKGKVNEEEDPARCAIREVLEETGFDITPYLDPQDYLDSIVNDQMVHLYVIRNVPKNTEFKPRTRCEIKACSWFAVADLPNNKKDATPKVKIGVSPNSFFMVLPFVKRLKQICFGQGYTSARKLTQKMGSCSESDKKKATASKEDTSQNKKRDKRQSKRQLFSGGDASDSVEYDFRAPSWESFKFNRDLLNS